MTLCVYAVVRPGLGRIGITGIAGERLHEVAAGPIAAVVGEVRAAPRTSEPAVRAYGRVVGALARRVPALLPVRFGTCVRGEDELRQQLGDRSAVLGRALTAVRGRVQMTVRIVDRDVGTRGSGPRRRDPGPGGPGDAGAGRRARGLERRTSGSESSRPGTAYLEARADARAREQAVPAFEPLRPAVRKWVRAERVERRGRVTTLYHLVPRGAAERYRRALGRAAQEAGARLLVSGPWPPYAFGDGR